MADEKNISGRPIAMDRSAKSSSKTLPAFLARPAEAPVYHGFQILEDVVVDGFSLNLIIDFEEGSATDGDAFVIAPDNSRAGIVWAFSEKEEIKEVLPIEKDRWGVWAVSFPFRMANREDPQRNLQAILPMLKPKGGVAANAPQK